MNTPRTKLSISWRSFMLSLACLSLVLQVLVADGYMLHVDSNSGELSMALCPGQGAMPGVPGNDGHDLHASHGQSDAPAHASGVTLNEVCDFETAAMATIFIELSHTPPHYPQVRTVAFQQKVAIPKVYRAAPLLSRAPPLNS